MLNCTTGSPKLAVMGRQVPWSKFKGKKAWVDIENKVDGYFPVVRAVVWLIRASRSWVGTIGPKADVFVVSDLRNDKIRDRTRWRTALAGRWLSSITAAMGEQGIFVKYKPSRP